MGWRGGKGDNIIFLPYKEEKFMKMVFKCVEEGDGPPF